jgi:methyltransferase family protein
VLNQLSKTVKSSVSKRGLDLLCLGRTAKTLLLKNAKKSDLQRWANEANLSKAWDGRTKMLASFLDPGSRVLEFGAGRMELARYLPNHCVYIPSDIVDRGNNTFVCDLNAQRLPPLPEHDVAVFSGVLEYVHDVRRLVAYLHEYCNTIAASYATTDFPQQKQTLTRRKHGWVNDYDGAALNRLFSSQGFECAQTLVWENQQLLFKFVSSRPPVPQAPNQ